MSICQVTEQQAQLLLTNRAMHLHNMQFFQVTYGILRNVEFRMSLNSWNDLESLLRSFGGGSLFLDTPTRRPACSWPSA